MLDHSLPASPIIIRDPATHSMGSSLPRYVSTRVHEFVDERSYREIVVRASYNRKLSASRKEKRDKLENWQRPTAEIVDGALQIHCFPGRDYVLHYASLVATHLELSGRDPTVVRIESPPPLLLIQTIRQLGYSSIQSTPLLLVAAANDHFAPHGADWTDHGAFMTRTSGKSTTWMAVKHSFWGDISYHLGSALTAAGFERIIFVGKLGSLRPNHAPNTTLATGSASSLNGDLVTWRNIFEGHAGTQTGRHITLPSVLQETVRWVEEHSSSFDFVDPEVGNFAAGVKGGGASFSYIHLVSDNLSHKYPHDLSNEREQEVRVTRTVAYRRIAAILREIVNATLTVA